jgi:hypothetical protein
VNDAIDPLQRRKTQVVAAAIGIHLIFGAFAVSYFPAIVDQSTTQSAIEQLRGSMLNIGYQIAALVACFAWLTLDSRQLDIRRPWWLNVGVVFLTTFFLAYYLYKTRRPGLRARAILALLGLLFACVVATMTGVVVGVLMRGPGV